MSQIQTVLRKLRDTKEAEKLEDYNRELEAIKLYYTNPPIEVSETSDKWFEKRLNKVNKLLNTHYSVDDLIDVEKE